MGVVFILIKKETIPIGNGTTKKTITPMEEAPKERKKLRPKERKVQFAVP